MDALDDTNDRRSPDPVRSGAITQVIEQVRAARAAGEILHDASIVSAHSELMPELGRELDKLRRIEAAWAATAAGPLPAAPAGEPPETSAVGPAEIELARALAADLERPTIEVAGYTVLREIGRGGQAVVFLAFKLNPGRRVALKVMRDGSLADDRALARFQLEAEILAELNHPNIVTIFETGLTADGSHYFAMNFIAGCGLDEFMHRLQKTDPDPGKLLRLFLRICDIVNAAHVKQIVHRDLKPGNIRIDERDEPHILDFGLARPAVDRTAGSEPVSVTGEFLGSLPWSSPEQAAGDRTKIDVRTDVYSLGVILYQMLTGGRFPYEVVGNIRDVLNNIVSTQPMPPSKVIAAGLAKEPRGTRRLATKHPAAVNEAIEKIVLKALAKQPDQRYQNAGELGRAIADYLLGRESAASPRAKTQRRPTGRASRRIAAITAVAAALVGITLWQILPQAESPMKPSRLLKSLVLLLTTGAFGGPKPAAPDNAPHAAPGLAVPDVATQAKKERLIRDVFGNFNAAPLADRPAIAAKMIEQGMATADDPAARFVLLKDGGELAASAGDAATAMRAATLLASIYAVDAGEWKLALLRKATAAATTPIVAAAVAQEGLNCANEAVAAGNYELANRFMPSTEQAARIAKDVTLILGIQSRAADIKWLQSESFHAKIAEDKLNKTPTDPDASHTLGRYYCLVRGDWTHGLIGLSKGSNPTYRAAAMADLAKPTATDKQVAAGDLWWDIAEKETAGAAQRALRRRAGYWYSQAVANPQFAGLSRALVEKKLGQIPPPGPGEAVAEVPPPVPAPAVPPPAVQPPAATPQGPAPVVSREPPPQAPAASAEMIAFARQRSAMPPDKQMPATLARLKELNGGADIKANLTIKGGEVRLDMPQQNALVNIEPLYGMRVTNLNLGGCEKLRSLNGIQGMPLTELSLANCFAIEGDLSMLAGMPLTTLHLGGCRKLRSLNGLQGMSLTGELNLSNSWDLDGDLSPLLGMKLTQLYLGSCEKLKSLNGLQGMPLTGELNLVNCWALEDISALKGMKLSHIILGECNKLRSLDGLAGMTLAGELNLTHCRALEGDLAALRGMQITSLNLTECKNLKSLNGTQGMPLKELVLPKHLAQGNVAVILQAFPGLETLKTNDAKTDEEAAAAIKGRKGLPPVAFTPPPGGSIFTETPAAPLSPTPSTDRPAPAPGETPTAPMTGGLLIASRVQGKQGVTEPAAGVICFDAPDGDGRRGAKGVLVRQPSGWAAAGTTWATTYSRSLSAEGVQFIHPLGNGQLMVQVKSQGVGVINPHAWIETGYRDFSKKGVTPTPAYDTVFPLKDNTEYAVETRVTATGAIAISVNGQVVATSRFNPADAHPLSLPSANEGSGGGTRKTTFKSLAGNPEMPQQLDAGDAMLLVGPLDRGINICTNVRLGAARAKSGAAGQVLDQALQSPAAVSTGALTNTLGMKLVRVESGEFMMGSPITEEGRKSEETLHQVKITKPFLMATTAVTQAQWSAVMGSSPSKFHGDNRPVEKVSWYDAVTFCEKLSAKEGKHYRLPTEAEWEYACRAGTQTAYGGTNNLNEIGWYQDNSDAQTHPVAQKKANAWGLYDMQGNVNQWCSDGYGGPYGGDAVDPKGANDSKTRVVRGGAWKWNSDQLRAAFRGRAAPGGRHDDVGFRICLDAAELPAAASLDLTTVQPTAVQVGFATLGVNQAPPFVDHLPILNGAPAARYFFAHAPSKITFAAGSFAGKTFVAKGIVTHPGTHGVIFIVQADGKEIFRSKLAKHDEVIDIEARLPADARVLELIADPDGLSTSAWAFWAYPGIKSEGPAAPAPAATSQAGGSIFTGGPAPAPSVTAPAGVPLPRPPAATASRVMVFRTTGRSTPFFSKFTRKKVVPVNRADLAATLANPETFNDYNILVFEPNALCWAKPAPDDAAGERLAHFVDKGGNLLIFAQVTNVNWNIIEKPFGIKASYGGGPQGIVSLDPALAARFKADGFSEQQLADVRVIARAQMPADKAVVLARSKFGPVADIMQFGQGRIIFIGGTLNGPISVAENGTDEAFDVALLAYLFGPDAAPAGPSVAPAPATNPATGIGGSIFGDTGVPQRK